MSDLETLDTLTTTAPTPSGETAPADGAASEVVADPTPASEPVGEATAPTAADGEASPEETPDDPDLSHEVELQLPQVDGADRGRIKIAGVTQEVADTIRHHQKQSARVPKLETDLATASEKAALVDFIASQPVDGLLGIAHQSPKAAQEFVGLYLQANPQLFASVAQSLGLKVTYDEGVDDRLLNANAKAAQLEQRQRIHEGQQSFEQNRATQAFVAQGYDTIAQLSGSLSLPTNTPAAKAFKATCEEALAELYHQNPRVDRAGMVAALQPIVDTFAQQAQKQQQVKVLRAQQAKEQPRDVAGQFAEKVKKAEKFRKLGGGVTALTPLSTEKLPPGTTLDDIIAGRVK